MRPFIPLAAVVLLAALIVAPAAAAQAPVAAAKTQMQTVVFHAGELAQRGTSVVSAKVHLQHSLNCLEGPKGKNYNLAPGDVCRGQGSGIIPDLQAAQAAGVRGAENALKFINAAHFLTVTALQSNDVDLVQPYGIVIANQVKLALAALP